MQISASCIKLVLAMKYTHSESLKRCKDNIVKKVKQNFGTTYFFVVVKEISRVREKQFLHLFS